MSASVLEETQKLSWPGARDLAIAFAGPAAVGACVGWTAGVGPMVQMTAALPLSILLVGMLTLPGLHIGAALADAAPDVTTMLQTALAAFKDQGIVYLGLTPALLFLTASSSEIHEALALGTIGVFLGAAVGIRAFYHRFRRVADDPRAVLLFVIWSLISAGLGWQLYLKILNVEGGLL